MDSTGSTIAFFPQIGQHHVFGLETLCRRGEGQCVISAVPFEKLFGVAAFVGDTCYEGKGRGNESHQIRYAVDDVFI